MRIHVLMHDKDHDTSQDSRELARLSHSTGGGNDLVGDLEFKIWIANKTIPIQSLQMKRLQSCIWCKASDIWPSFGLTRWILGSLSGWRAAQQQYPISQVSWPQFRRCKPIQPKWKHWQAELQSSTSWYPVQEQGGGRLPIGWGLDISSKWALGSAWFLGWMPSKKHKSKQY